MSEYTATSQSPEIVRLRFFAYLPFGEDALSVNENAFRSKFPLEKSIVAAAL